MKALPWLSASALRAAVLDLLFPLRCFGCEREGALLCHSCLAGQERLLPPICDNCGTRSISNLCDRCRRESYAFDGIRSAFTYQGAIRESVIQLKYHGITEVASVLGAEMARLLYGGEIPCEVLLPVPLHPKRLKERGYNQAGLLCLAVGAETGMPVDEQALVREKATPSQAKSAGMEERRRQVEGAFRASSEAVAGKHVAVVDDVCTTGATLDACAKALKDAGAATVWGLTVAREL